MRNEKQNTGHSDQMVSVSGVFLYDFVMEGYPKDSSVTFIILAASAVYLCGWYLLLPSEDLQAYGSHSHHNLLRAFESPGRKSLSSG